VALKLGLGKWKAFFSFFMRVLKAKFITTELYIGEKGATKIVLHSAHANASYSS